MPTLQENKATWDGAYVWVQSRCERLHVVDLSEECIAACRQRFTDRSHITYTVNDGRSLDSVRDASVDFVFSLDSQVHADAGVLQTYVSQLGRILRPDGAAFLHHSNLGEYPYYTKGAAHVLCNPNFMGQAASLAGLANVCAPPADSR